MRDEWLGIRFEIRESRYFQTSAALLLFMRLTDPVDPTESAPPLSHAIKGQYAPRANPTPFSKSQHVHCRLLIFSIDRRPQGGVVYG